MTELIKEKEMICQVFIDSLHDYFYQLSNDAVKTEIPFQITEDTELLNDYTGIITISGNKKGYIYISGTKKMFSQLINIITNIENPSTEDILDMAGEMTNTIAGNVRKAFGHHFFISVPIILQGKPKMFKIDNDTNKVYAVPFKWRNYLAYMVISLD